MTLSLPNPRHAERLPPQKEHHEDRAEIEQRAQRSPDQANIPVFRQMSPRDFNRL